MTYEYEGDGPVENKVKFWSVVPGVEEWAPI